MHEAIKGALARGLTLVRPEQPLTDEEFACYVEVEMSGHAQPGRRRRGPGRGAADLVGAAGPADPGADGVDHGQLRRVGVRVAGPEPGAGRDAGPHLQPGRLPMSGTVLGDDRVILLERLLKGGWQHRYDHWGYYPWPAQAAAAADQRP